MGRGPALGQGGDGPCTMSCGPAVLPGPSITELIDGCLWCAVQTSSPWIYPALGCIPLGGGHGGAAVGRAWPQVLCGMGGSCR